MPQIVYSEQANRDIVRLAEFVQEIEPNLKQRVIVSALNPKVKPTLKAAMAALFE